MSDIKTIAAYIVLKLDQINQPIPDKIFGNSPLTKQIAKQVCFLYKKKSAKNGKRILEIKENNEEKRYSIFLLMT